MRIVARLRHHLGPAALRRSDELGLPADAEQAYLVALLGWLTWHRAPGVAPGGTGGTGGTGAPVARVLGRMSPGDAALRLPEPLAPPRSLVVLP